MATLKDKPGFLKNYTPLPPDNTSDKFPLGNTTGKGQQVQYKNRKKRIDKKANELFK